MGLSSILVLYRFLCILLVLFSLKLFFFPIYKSFFLTPFLFTFGKRKHEVTHVVARLSLTRDSYISHDKVPLQNEINSYRKIL